MKRTSNVLRSLSSLLFVMMMGFVFSAFTGVSAAASVGVAVGGSALLSLVQMPVGAFEPVLLQLWETELINKFRHEHGWLSAVPSRDNYVNNDAINLSEIGVDPSVLINTTLNKIPVQRREDGQKIIALNQYDTENTQITDEELYALPYDKEGSVLRQHREVLEETSGEYSLYNLAPASNATESPIVATTGADNGSSRKRLTSTDIINMKKKFDDLKIPKQGRILVLCNDHVSDLLVEDLNGNFSQAYNNRATGAISTNYYGFTVYESAYNPRYNGSNVKVAFADTAAGTDRNSSVVFYNQRAVKAKGSAKVFIDRAENNPETRASTFGARMYHVCIPKTTLGFGAIVSASV